MNFLKRQSMLTSVLFAVAGIAFAVASLLARQNGAPSADVFVHGTYFVVGHVHLLGIGALVCLLYAVLYYLSARLLHLTLSVGLSLSHFAITLLALIGLGNMRYLGLGQRQPPVVSPLVGLLAINALTLLLVGGFVFVGIMLLASMMKLRQDRRST